MTRVAILGATGAVGSTLLRVLEERSFPLDELRLLASERSAGEQRSYAGRELTVQAVGPGSFDGIDLAIFSAGATRSREWAPQAVAAGAVVVDNSSAFRMDEGVPLVVADVNPHAARGARGPDREPQLLDDAAHARAGRAAPPLAARARHGRDLPGGLGHRPEGGRRAAARQSAAVLAGEEPEAGRLCPPHRVQRAALRRIARRATTATPTRSSSSSTSRARSSSCPSCASARPACACRS